MLMTPKGNLGQVYSALQEWRVGDVVDHDPVNPLSAEIVPEVSPNWHVLETHPNHERTVASYLIARRFGMFVPETEADEVRRGRKMHVTRLMFTGYVFVFVWDIGKHANRLMAIPGVARIMCYEDSLKRPKPVVVSDAIIDQIRAVENSKRPLPAVMVDDDVVYPKKKRARWRKHRKDKSEVEQERANDIMSVRPWSAFQDALIALDESGRDQALMRALSLPS